MALGGVKAQVTALPQFLLSTFYCSTPLVKRPVKDGPFTRGAARVFEPLMMAFIESVVHLDPLSQYPFDEDSLP